MPTRNLGSTQLSVLVCGKALLHSSGCANYTRLRSRTARKVPDCVLTVITAWRVELRSPIGDSSRVVRFPGA